MDAFEGKVAVLRRALAAAAQRPAADDEPLTHLTVLASDALHGRFSSSTEFSQAAQYVAQVLKRHSVPGASGQPETPYFQTFPLGHLSRGGTENVVARIEGSGPHRDEAIVLMAHLDHVGQDAHGVVFNGADDNASGSATLLASVPKLVALQKQGKLDRSVILLWTSGEEEGLLGSRQFVKHPPPGIELSKIKGAINMDMVGRLDADRLSVIDSDGDGTPTFFHALLEQTNATLEHPFQRINHDLDEYIGRQDGAWFTQEGIPALLLFEGLSNPKGGGNLIPEYHGAADKVALILRDNNGEKLRHVRDLLVALAVASSNLPPKALAS